MGFLINTASAKIKELKAKLMSARDEVEASQIECQIEDLKIFIGKCAMA